MGLLALANGDVWETIRAVQKHVQDGRSGVQQQGGVGAVSYTHLTLPTILLV